MHPRQADALELVEVERRFCLSVSQLFPEESRCLSVCVCSEVRVIQSNSKTLRAEGEAEHTNTHLGFLRVPPVCTGHCQAAELPQQVDDE